MAKLMPATSIRWLIFALACAASWLLYLHRYTFNFIGPELTREYGYSQTALGALFGLFYVTYGLFQVPSGLICDAGGTRAFLAASIVLWSAALALFGSTGERNVLAALRLLFGGAQAGAYPALAKVSRVWFPRPVRTMMQGIVATTCGRLGGAMSPIIMATVLMGLCGMSWRMALVVMSGLGVVLAAAFVWLFRESPAADERVNEAERQLIAGSPERKVEPKVPCEGTDNRPAACSLSKHSAGPKPAGAGAFSVAARMCRSRSLAALCVQQGCSAGADAIYVSLLGSFFLDRYSVQLGSAGLLASLPLVGGACGGLVGGWLNDRSCRRLGLRWGRSAVGFAGPFIAALLMLIVIRQQTALAAGLGLLAVKFFVDWNQPTVWGAAADLGGRFTGTAFAVVNTAGTITTIICPPIFGLILDYNTTYTPAGGGGDYRNVNYGPLFLTIAGIYAAGASTWLAIDCRQRIDEGEQVGGERVRDSMF